MLLTAALPLVVWAALLLCCHLQVQCTSQQLLCGSQVRPTEAQWTAGRQAIVYSHVGVAKATVIMASV